MQRDYDATQPARPARGITTRLAHIHLPCLEDVAIASPATNPADDVQTARNGCSTITMLMAALMHIGDGFRARAERSLLTCHKGLTSAA